MLNVKNKNNHKAFVLKIERTIQSHTGVTSQTMSLNTAVIIVVRTCLSILQLNAEPSLLDFHVGNHIGFAHSQKRKSEEIGEEWRTCPLSNSRESHMKCAVWDFLRGWGSALPSVHTLPHSNNWTELAGLPDLKDGRAKSTERKMCNLILHVIKDRLPTESKSKLIYVHESVTYARQPNYLNCLNLKLPFQVKWKRSEFKSNLEPDILKQLQIRPPQLAHRWKRLRECLLDR